jgi:two-component system NtrC family sensor kinase
MKMQTLQCEPESSANQIAGRVDWLERRLAAARKVNDVLMDRLERRDTADSSAFSIIEQNVALESIVSRKTRELEAERGELHKTLDDLRATQTRLLQAQKMESIGQLAAGMAHEINTPIQYVTDNVSFVRRCFDPVMLAVESASELITDWHEGKLTAERIAEAEARLKRLKFDYIKINVPPALAQSLEGLQRVASIVAAMKDFSHPSSDSKELVDLADIVKIATTVARSEWKYVADLEVIVEPGLPQVPCLRNEIGQVVLNLVVNAAHAIADVVRIDGSSEKGKLTVQVHRVGEFAEIRIQDTGTGIPEAIRGRVFDPFFTTKPVGRGTGQGLAICYSTVVEKHKGELFFETEIGRGTAFCVRLPLAAEPDGST